MPDIAMCLNTECPKRTTCYRFMATPSRWQAYGEYDHENCTSYWPIEEGE